MILLSLALASSPSGSQNFLTEILIQVNFFKDHIGLILPYSEVVSLTKLFIKLGMISHFEMRTSNVKRKNLDLTDLRCLSQFQSWLIQGFSEKPYFSKHRISNFCLDRNMGLFKVRCPMYPFFENSGGKLQNRNPQFSNFLCRND